MIKCRDILPPSINNYWKPKVVNGRYTGNYITQKAKDFKQYLYILAKNARMKKIEGDCRLVYRLYLKKQGRRDLDNTIKVIQDALEGVAYANDRQIVQIYASLERNAGFDGFDILIEEIE